MCFVFLLDLSVPYVAVFINRPKEAAKAIRKRFGSKDSSTTMLTLKVCLLGSLLITDYLQINMFSGRSRIFRGGVTSGTRQKLMGSVLMGAFYEFVN